MRFLAVTLLIGAVFYSWFFRPAPGAPRDNPYMWAHNSTLRDHFLRHGLAMSTLTKEQYSKAASEFLWRAVSQNMPNFLDTNGVHYYYNPLSHEFGIYAPGGNTITYFRRSPPLWYYNDLSWGGSATSPIH